MERMIRSIHAFPLLEAFRGQPPIDLLPLISTLHRLGRLGLDFPMISEIDDMDGATVCVTSGTTTEGNLADAFRLHSLALTTQVFADTEASFVAYDVSGCDCYTSDKSQLASLRTTAAIPGDHIILPDTISKEPLGPLVRHGDNEWFDIVKWTVFATFFAEEYGITQANVTTFESTNPEVRRFLGLESGMGAKLGLAEDWAVNVISAVGNYGEIYDRHLGPDGLDIPRAGSLNALWTQVDLFTAPRGAKPFN